MGEDGRKEALEGVEGGLVDGRLSCERWSWVGIWTRLANDGASQVSLLGSILGSAGVSWSRMAEMETFGEGVAKVREMAMGVIDVGAEFEDLPMLRFFRLRSFGESAENGGEDVARKS